MNCNYPNLKIKSGKNLQRFFFRIFLFLFIYHTNVSAQSLKRECVASTGSSTTTDGTSIQQTIGQPYGTAPNYSNNIKFTPGFQQPIYKIEVIKSTINVSLFPNPTSERVTIQAASPLENVTVQIIDMNGKLLLNEKINELKSYTINCSNWANGVYVITLSDSKNDLYSSKLVISR
jgi:hypothetical protein